MQIPDEALAILTEGVPLLGEPRFDSPLKERGSGPDGASQYQDEEERVLASPFLSDWKEDKKSKTAPPSFELAGPRPKLFFDPKKTRAAIVTCGGLCPGLNDVIRRVTMTFTLNYGLRQVYGIRYGYRGLVEGEAEAPMLLRPEDIEPISNDGGTYLGSSRGDRNPVDMVDFLQRREIQILIAVGGDGTQKGALAIANEADKRGYPLSVVGLPKTIDNDIGLVEKTFGFDTAVAIATEVLKGAHVEAEAEEDGVVIVKLMGRQSGFLAANASVASGDVNYVLIPEVEFDLEGPKGLLACLHQRLKNRKHALIAVAEGVAERLVASADEKERLDASGNALFDDVGVYLKSRISNYFKEMGFPARIRYLDPSYYVRSLPANPTDSIFCQNLAHNAVHAAMSGRTRMLVATCHGVYCHIPMEAVVLGRQFVDPEGPLWRSVLETTGQPARMVN
jgi:6-phosphofructokinase 1